MQTINNPDGTLSIIQIDTAGSQLTGQQIVTLADGTQATVVQTVSSITTLMSWIRLLIAP